MRRACARCATSVERHRDVAVLAFSEYASTVRAYFAAMRADAGVGMLTASEARIASGRLSRDELLARFAPLAQGASAPHPRERVTLLLATDLLSEGVNLQDAAVVVHLDLPWNPARLAQRLGRIRRPGGASEVTSYLMAPPARSGLLLRAEVRLREKLAQAERTIGRGLDVLPALSAGASGRPELPHETVGATSPTAVDAPPLRLQSCAARSIGRSSAGVARRRAEDHRHRTPSSPLCGLHWRGGSPCSMTGASSLPSTSDLRRQRAALKRRMTSQWSGGRFFELSTDNSMPTEVLAAKGGKVTTGADAMDRRRLDTSLVRHRCLECPVASARAATARRCGREASTSSAGGGDSPLASKLREALARRMTLGAERALSAHGAIAGDLHPLRWLEDAVALVSTPADHSTATQDASRRARARAIVLLCRE